LVGLIAAKAESGAAIADTANAATIASVVGVPILMISFGILGQQPNVTSLL
jgi:hypothetical protein